MNLTDKWYELSARFRRPLPPLPREPLGTLVFGNVQIPVDEIKLSHGMVTVSGEKLNPFPGGMKGAGWPRTYQLLDLDGELVREGPIPWTGDIGISTSVNTWRITVSIDIRAVLPRGLL